MLVLECQRRAHRPLSAAPLAGSQTILKPIAAFVNPDSRRKPSRAATLGARLPAGRAFS